MVGVIAIVATVLVLFTIGYVGYGRYLARFVELDDSRATPAHKYEDGQEYVPAKKPVLLGHHFSSVAGGAPIAGPITAALVWGWLPALLWVAIGNPLMGAVHDFMSLSSSIRHEGKSIGFIIGEYLGEQGKNMFLTFAWLVIILVVAVFALLVAIILNAYPAAATASLLYIGLALVFGVWLYQLDLPFIPGTALFVAGVFASVWVGMQFPISLFATEADAIVLLGGDGSWVPGAGPLGSGNVAAWTIVALVYAFVASVLPVWTLLQPRDYLSSFLLYAGVGGTLLAVIVGTFFGTTSGGAAALEIQLPAYEGFMGGDLVGVAMPLFPLLFITIACGTISGFHSLVSSGTTAKQLNRESDARLIGYGGMLMEGLLAATALAAVSVVALTGPEGETSGIAAALPNFADGGGLILTSFGIPEATGAVFMALVFVSFLLTSLDTGLRLGRYMLEELAGPTATSTGGTTSRTYGFTFLTTLLAFILVGSGQWAQIWPLFGGANQLLAALALLAATVWIANWSDTKQLLTTGVPVAIMAVVTICGLLWLAFVENLQRTFLADGWLAEATIIEIGSSALRFVLALVLIYLALSIIRMGYANIQSERESATGSTGPGPGEEPGPGDD